MTSAAAGTDTAARRRDIRPPVHHAFLYFVPADRVDAYPCSRARWARIPQGAQAALLATMLWSDGYPRPFGAEARLAVVRI